MASSMKTASSATVNPATGTMGCCYSTITNQTVNVISSSPFHATVTLNRTLEGSNSISDPDIKHRGSVTASVGTRSQTTQGQWLTPNIYINLNASVTLDTNLDTCLLNGPGCADESSDSVTCTVGGLVYAFQESGPPLLRIASTYFGPPVVVGGDNKCFWGSLACSAGTQPTCRAGSGYLFAPKCPDYVKTDYLVINNGVTAPVCIAIGFIIAEAGPGPCD